MRRTRIPMFLDDILERNRGWVRGRQPEPLPPVARLRLAVVGCYDPRLDPLLLPALGLEPGDAFLLRSAGALIHAGSSSMRSLALAIYMFGVDEVLVVGHAACRMAAFDTGAFIEEFRRRGVPREAFGDEDLRAWAGAIASPRQGVLVSVAAVREAPFVPRDVRVGGVVLDEVSGELEVVVRPDQAIDGAVGAPVAGAGREPAPANLGGGAIIAGPVPTATAAPPTRPSPATPAAAAPPAPAKRPARPAPAEPAPPAPPSPPHERITLNQARERAARSTAAPTATPAPAAAAGAARGGRPAAGDSRVAQTREMLQAVEDFLTLIGSQEHWRADLENLRDELERRTDTRQRIELLDAFARRLAGESRELADAFARLRQTIAAAGADPATELLSVFQYLGGRR